MDWIVRNISFLAFFLVLAAFAGIALRLLAMLSAVGRLGLMPLIGELIAAAIGVIAIAVGYGILVRFLGLCDDMAAIRRTQTGTRASLD